MTAAIPLTKLRSGCLPRNGAIVQSRTRTSVPCPYSVGEARSRLRAAR
jgi:hypothetical protein